MRACAIWPVAVFVLLNPTATLSQAVYGSVSGTLTDSLGKPITHAMVTLISEEKATAVKATTGSDGRYSINHLVPDNYDLHIEASGYKNVRTAPIQVSADSDTAVNVKVPSGNSSETSDIPGGGSALKGDRVEVSTSFVERQIQELPVFDRDFTRLEALVPGATKVADATGTLIVPQIVRIDPITGVPILGLTRVQIRGNLAESNSINLNSQHFSGTSFQLDGTDIPLNTDGKLVQTPNLESLKEMKFSTQDASLEFGQATAGTMVAQTKSGTSHWHGSAFESRRSGWSEAGPPDLPRPEGPEGQDGSVAEKRNQFRASIGGPLIMRNFFLPTTKVRVGHCLAQ